MVHISESSTITAGDISLYCAQVTMVHISESSTITAGGYITLLCTSNNGTHKLEQHDYGRGIYHFIVHK